MSGEAAGRDFLWPAGAAETPINLRTVRNIPRSGFVNNFLVDLCYGVLDPRVRARGTDG